MLDKTRFKEVTDEGTVTLPGNIKIKDVDITDEELAIYEKDMDRHSFKVLNVFSVIGPNNKALNKRSASKYYLDLSDLDKSMSPLFLIEKGQFIGVCISLTYNRITSLGVFLVNGEHYGASQKGSTKVHDFIEESDIDTYSFGFK